jgi:hypothetical protein
MIAIETKYLGPTNYRGARYTAYTCNGQRVTHGADDSLNSDENQLRVATALAHSMGWLDRPTLRLVGGSTKQGMCFVFVED